MPDATKLAQEKLWGDAMAARLRYALYLTRSGARAEELAAEALAISLDPERSPWDPNGETTLSEHVVKVVRGLMKAEARKKQVRSLPANAKLVADRLRPPALRTDGRIRAQEEQARGEQRLQEVRASLDPFKQQVLDLYGQGLSPAEQAERLGVGERRVYEARRKIAERVRALPVEDDARGDPEDLSFLRDDDDTGEDEVVP